jgi:K+-transporting ATPase ATPase C chain
MQARASTRQLIRPAIVALVLFTLLTGVIYPLLVTVIAQVAFPSQANGSLITASDGTVVGSRLIGQEFNQPHYFWGRLSATGPVPYNAAASSGSNLGPLNPALVGDEGLVQNRIAALRAADSAAGVDSNAPIPVDLVTASGSGLDPQISPAAAAYQAGRVAALRGTTVENVEALIGEFTEGRTLGLLGEGRVNVLLLNLALDERYPSRAQ